MRLNIKFILTYMNKYYKIISILFFKKVIDVTLTKQINYAMLILENQSMSFRHFCLNLKLALTNLCLLEQTYLLDLWQRFFPKKHTRVLEPAGML